ncbi:MAG: hypothetical protein QXG26_01870 [Candidatus Aenigmatarchaeota archaeon]
MPKSKRRVKGFYTDEHGRIRPITDYCEEPPFKGNREEIERIWKEYLDRKEGDTIYTIYGPSPLAAVNKARSLLSKKFGTEGILVDYIVNEGKNLLGFKLYVKDYVYVYHRQAINHPREPIILWKLVKVDKVNPSPEDEVARVGGRHLMNIAEGKGEGGASARAPIYLHHEVKYEKPDPFALEFYKKLPIDESAVSWSHAPPEEISKRLQVHPLKFKYGAVPVRVKDLSDAERIAHALAYMHGGAEIVPLPDKTYVVKSRGYYHYIGA